MVSISQRRKLRQGQVKRASKGTHPKATRAGFEPRVPDCKAHALSYAVLKEHGSLHLCEIQAARCVCSGGADVVVTKAWCT